MSTVDVYLRNYAQSGQAQALKNEIAEVWQTVRGSDLYSGQPRNNQSDQTVARALIALRVASQSNDRLLMADACRLMAHALNAVERYDESLPHYQKAIDLFESAGAGEQAARTRLGFMAGLYMTGKYDEAIDVADCAERWFRTNNHLSGQAQISANIGNLYYRREMHQQALKYHYKARDLFERLNDWHGLATTYLNLGNCLSLTDKLTDADQMYALAEEVSARLELRISMADSLNRLGSLALGGSSMIHSGASCVDDVLRLTVNKRR